MAIYSINKGKDLGQQAWGDSLVEGQAGGNPFYKKWPLMLGAKFKPGIPVFNGGVGGETAAQIATRFLAYSKVNTQIIGFWAGRNGVLTLTPESIVATITTMIDHVGDDRWYILSVIPYADGSEAAGSTNRNKILALNALIQSTWPSHYVDVFTDLDSNSLRTDGLHLNAAGSDIVAAKVFEFQRLKEWYPEEYYAA